MSRTNCRSLPKQTVIFLAHPKEAEAEKSPPPNHIHFKFDKEEGGEEPSFLGCSTDSNRELRDELLSFRTDRDWRGSPRNRSAVQNDPQKTSVERSGENRVSPLVLRSVGQWRVSRHTEVERMSISTRSTADCTLLISVVLVLRTFARPSRAAPLTGQRGSGVGKRTRAVEFPAPFTSTDCQSFPWALYS
jgi:hypothetical protein